jgi:hypothetical protein
MQPKPFCVESQRKYSGDISWLAWFCTPLVEAKVVFRDRVPPSPCEASVETGGQKKAGTARHIKSPQRDSPSLPHTPRFASLHFFFYEIELPSLKIRADQSRC